MRHQRPSSTITSRFGFLLVTGALFLISLLAHWWLGWSAFEREQREAGRPPLVADYVVEAGRDTFENWQSEFLQLIWQVAGLALLYHVGSPQSREADDRLEEKIDAVLRAVTPEADAVIGRLDKEYLRGQ